MHAHVCRRTCTDMYTVHCMYGNECTLGCDLFENEGRLQEQPRRTPSPQYALWCHWVGWTTKLSLPAQGHLSHSKSRIHGHQIRQQLYFVFFKRSVCHLLGQHKAFTPTTWSSFLQSFLLQWANLHRFGHLFSLQYFRVIFFHSP